MYIMYNDQFEEKKSGQDFDNNDQPPKESDQDFGMAGNNLRGHTKGESYSILVFVKEEVEI